MSRNLTRISAKGVLLRLAFGLYAIVFCQAIVQDTLWLWILSIAGAVAVIALSGAAKEQNIASRPAESPFIHSSTPRLPYSRAGLPPPGAPGGNPLKYVEGGQAAHSTRLRSDSQARLDLEEVLFSAPPICLN